MKEETKKILIAVGIAAIILLFAFNLFLIKKEKIEKPAESQKFDFGTGAGINKWAYEGASFYNNTIDYAKQVMPAANAGTEFNKEKYAELANLNDNVFAKTETFENDKHAFQIFKFNLGDLRNFTSLKITWKGYGAGAMLQCLNMQNNKCVEEDFTPRQGTSIHLWHDEGKFWAWAGDTFVSGRDSSTYREFSKEITEAGTGIPMNFYLDNENNIYILAITAKPAMPSKNISSVLKTDYIGIEVK